MWLNATEVTPDCGILLPSDICNKMGLTVGDHVALIYVDNHVIMRKVTSGNGRMTFEEFLNYRDVKIKNHNHEKIVRLFYVYLASVTGDNVLLNDILRRLLNIDVSSIQISTGCFNGIFDGTEPPYEDVDFYIRFSNEMRIYIYGSIPLKPLRELKDNEHVIIMLSDDINGIIERKANRHIWIT